MSYKIIYCDGDSWTAGDILNPELEKQGEFLRQWNESFKDEPNYDSITWTSRNQEMRTYHILVNTDEGVSRVMKKTGDKETRTTIDETTSTSFLSDDKYINKEK